MVGTYPKKGFTPSKNARSVPVKRNTSILNFFQKTDGPPTPTSRQPRITQFTTKIERSTTVSFGKKVTGGNETLFLEDVRSNPKPGGENTTAEEPERARSRTPDYFWGNGDSDSLFDTGEKRFNESDSAVKRRKVDVEVTGENGNGSDLNAPKPPKPQRSGPFIDESDSEDDLGVFNDIEEPSLAITKEQEQTTRRDPPDDNDLGTNGRDTGLDPTSLKTMNSKETSS